MNISKISGVEIMGIYACLPQKTVDNRVAGADLFGDSIDDLIVATGIQSRRICSEDVTGLDLCIKAADDLLNNLGVEREDIGGLVYVTFTPDNAMPNNSSVAQHRLNLPKSIPAFDINIACSGYIYGLWIASLMAKSINRQILLLDGDKQSHISSPYDKSTALLFSDGGSATIVSPSEQETRWYFAFETDGSKKDALIINDGGARNHFNKDSLNYNLLEDGGKRRNLDIKMDGLEVFKFVSQGVKANISGLMTEINRTPESFDYLVLHQANLYMMKQLCKKLRFSLNQMPVIIDKYGNTSSSSIPITLASELVSINSGKDLDLIISGFGAGFSAGSAAITLKKSALLGVVEHE